MKYIRLFENIKFKYKIGDYVVLLDDSEGLWNVNTSCVKILDKCSNENVIKKMKIC